MQPVLPIFPLPVLHVTRTPSIANQLGTFSRASRFPHFFLQRSSSSDQNFLSPVLRPHHAEAFSSASTSRRQKHRPHHGHIYLAFLLSPLCISAACLAFIYYESLDRHGLLHLDEDFDEMQLPPGRPGNLTVEQEEKLRQLWTRIFKLYNLDAMRHLPPAKSEEIVSPAIAKSDTGAKLKKSRLGFFSLSNSTDVSLATSDNLPPESSPFIRKASVPLGKDVDDKYGHNKKFLETLQKQSPESIRATIWSMIKQDHPDHLALRFLRARKWDVEKALVMLISTVNWRHEHMKVDDVIMTEGELVPAEKENSDGLPSKEKRLASDFLNQMRMGKSFFHGVDKHQRPICVVRVRLHRPGEHSVESLERYTVYLFETGRLLMAPPVDTANILFDMTNFTIANMDYTPVKFMIQCFEANYPESLGVVLVHKAPWVFQGFWKIIRGWLDPVVVSKIHFTNNLKDLEEFIPPQQILAELDGQESWWYKYDEAVPGENDRMKDTATRDRLLTEREEVVKQFERKTIEWIENPEDEQVKVERNILAEKLRKGYWDLDPYVRARSWYDRKGVLLPGGKVVTYPERDKVHVNGEMNGVAEKREDIVPGVDKAM